MCRDVTAVERQLDGSKRLEMSDERFDLLKVRERATAAGDRQGQVRYERLFLTHARVVSRWRNDVAQLHKFRQQLMAYKLLVEGSHEYANYAVDKGILEKDVSEIDLRSPRRHLGENRRASHTLE